MISTAGWPAGWCGNAGRWRQRSSPSWSRSAGLHRLAVSIDNQATADGLTGKDAALRRSLLGTHMIIECRDPHRSVPLGDRSAQPRS